MIYVLIGVIGLLVIILVAMGIALWQDKDYVYTGEYLNEITFSTKQECQDRINMVLKDYNDFKNERLEDNKKFMELTSLYATLLHNSFEFNSKYNVGDKIAYSVNGKVKFGNVKNIIVEVAKNDEKIYQYDLYLYLTKEGDRVYEEQIISKQ